MARGEHDLPAGCSGWDFQEAENATTRERVAQEEKERATREKRRGTSFTSVDLPGVAPSPGAGRPSRERQDRQKRPAPRKGRAAR